MSQEQVIGEAAMRRIESALQRKEHWLAFNTVPISWSGKIFFLSGKGKMPGYLPKTTPANSVIIKLSTRHPSGMSWPRSLTGKN